jgi:hypothetical protein
VPGLHDWIIADQTGCHMKTTLLIAHVILLFTVFYFLWRKTDPRLAKYFWPAILLKIAAGIGVGVLYMYHYRTGDTLNYFADGKVLSAVARENFGNYIRFLWDDSGGLEKDLFFSEPRALFFVKFVSLFNLITADNYWLSASYFSVISFFATWQLLKKINAFLPETTLPAFIAFLFFPSVVFWTSGLIKESLACAALFYLTAILLDAWFKQSVKIHFSIIAVPALWILWSLKYYLAAIFIPVVLTCVFYRFLILPVSKPKTFGAEIFLWVFLFICPLALISFMHPNFYFSNFLEVIVSNNEIYNQSSAANDIIEFYALKPEVGSIIRNTPMALFSGLFQPLIFEVSNPLQIIAGIENLLLLFLFIFSLKNTKHILQSPHRVLIFGLIVYVCLLCVFITLSTPNFGTLSRYRTGYISYFIFLILCGNPAVMFIQRSWLRLVH